MSKENLRNRVQELYAHYAEDYFLELESDGLPGEHYNRGAMDAIVEIAKDLDVNNLRENALAAYFAKQLTKRLLERNLLKDHVAESAEREMDRLLAELLVDTK